MKIDTLVVNGKLVNNEAVIEPVTIGIREGKIAFVGEDIFTPDAAKTIDARGNYIMPGVIDLHTHMGAYRPYEDDVLSETKAAAVGGVTTVFHYIVESDSIHDRIPYYIESTKRLATVDMGFHALLKNEIHIKEIEQCRDRGIKIFKFLLAYRGGEMKQFAGVDYIFLYRGMEMLKEVDGIAAVHAENYELLQLFKKRYEDQSDFASFCRSRPAICEEVDAFLVCSMGEKTGCAVFIAHVGAPKVLQIARHFCDEGNQVFIEAQARKLTIDEEGTGLKEPYLAKSTPPYRTKAEIEKMWQGLIFDEVDVVATDSACQTYENKVKGRTIWDMPPGWQEMPTSLPMMITEGVKKRGIDLPKIVTLMSYNPARILGIYPQKGAIQPGSDADMIIVDLDKKQVASGSISPSVCDFTPYEGWELQGWPILTMVRGKIVMEEGKVLDTVGWGRAVNIT